jgi:hypothetical protein
MRALIASLALLTAAAVGSTMAETSAAPEATVIYRCTAPNGAVALQDDPCPRGQTQETREIAAFAAPPAAPMPADDAPPVIIVSDAPPPAPRLFMPPPLWRCTDLNGKSRLSDVYDPQPRCVPLSVLGVDLRRAPPSAGGLCRTVEDECVELGGEAACAAWEERLDAAESALRHAFSSDAPARRRERDRAKEVVDNDCRP